MVPMPRPADSRLILTATLALVLLCSRDVWAQATKACPTCADAAAVIARFGLRESATAVREMPGWAPPRRIVTWGNEEWIRAIRGVAPNAEIIAAANETEALKSIATADIFVGLCTPAIIEAGRNLKWMQLISAGADACSRQLQQRNILLTNMQAIYGPQVSEHAMALLLSLSRKLPRYALEQQSGQWKDRPADPAAILAAGMFELDGKNLLIVGLGGIGTEIARKAHAFGMHVRATRNSGRDKPDFVEYVGLAPEAIELAKWADVVINVTPLTPDTRGMFNATFFAAMKPSAHFINVGRGESVVTADLVDALRNKRIAGAALDVTDPEPLPPGHPLWSMPNVVLMPHTAAGSDQVTQRALALVVENIRRYVNGEKMLSVVDINRGY
jgi:phosphoglycerate dehydrogenase-like enzyme